MPTPLQNRSHWLEAPEELVEQIARKFCERHAYEIWGTELKERGNLENRWRCFEMEARDAVSLVREWDEEKV